MRALLLGTSSASAGAVQNALTAAAARAGDKLRTVRVIIPVPSELAEEGARGGRAEGRHGTVVALYDELLCGRRRQTPAGRRFVVGQLRRLACLKAGLQCREHAAGRAV